DEVFAFDHVKHRILLLKTVRLHGGEDLEAAYAEAQTALDRMQELAEAPMGPIGPVRLAPGEVRSNTTRERFEDQVRTAQSHIHEGDIFQVVLSQRFAKGYSGDRFQFYRALRMVNPSPYLFHLELGDFALIGSSPEVLV